MGKTTLYHPISLHVLRGAAEFCGFKFGKVKQVFSDQRENRAKYVAEIVEFPGGMDPDKASHKTLIGAVKKCFMDDILVVALWRSKKGQYFVNLDVELNRKPEKPGMWANAEIGQ